MAGIKLSTTFMYLEKLQLNGFKSFAHKVELKFNRGITAIVGPNGSGKSNVADAIRWVLGEQSLKSIRGKKSADVIFAGSSKRSRLGMAEVILHLNNEDHQAPLDYSEIALTRRFYRSGEGEYFINNSRVRLTDIQILMAQANVGSKTYSVIGQGQIDSVLVATPAERKEFFDEATGVKQYQIKRDQALNKLERTYENVSQGKLMLGEIKPHLRSLTRQVRRLEQKELVEKELRSWQHYYYFNLWQEYAQAQAKLDKDKQGLSERIKSLETEAGTLQTEINRSGSKQSQEDEFTNLQQQYEKTQKSKQLLLRELALLEGRRDLDLAKSGDQDMIWIKRRHQELEQKIGDKQSDREKLETIMSELAQALAGKQNEQESLLIEINDYQEKINKAAENSLVVTMPEVKLHLLGALSKLQNLRKEVKDSQDVAAWRAAWSGLDEVAQTLSELASSLPDTPTGPAQKEVGKWRQQFNDLQKSRDLLLVELGDLKVENKVVEVRLDLLTEEIEALAKEAKQLAARAKTDSNREFISESENQLKRQIAELDEELAGVNDKLKSFNKAQQAQKEQLLAGQSELQKIQQEINNHNRQLGGIEVELAKLDTKLEDLAMEVNRELKVFMVSLVDDWKKEPPTVEAELNRPEVLEKIDSLKKRREMIGGIEPEAVSEYEEVKARHDFLAGQVSDLTESLEKLKATIDDLDKIISKKFTDNFHSINELFNKYFRMLFNGGRAELVFLKNEIAEKEQASDESELASESDKSAIIEESEEEEEDNLIKMYRSKRFIQGIDIKAVPPGKKMKSISMLSGGERALTSIALICAMIANNPSPFVVLDEVDAALDEANSLRFAEIIADLAKQTQFVIITHNRATMEKADILYGITMGNDGVSNFLSVRFEQAQEYANRY